MGVGKQMTDKTEMKSFTLVFKGDIRAFTKNPLNTETIYGIPYAIAAFDALERLDKLMDEKE
jgi:hypothetical protein